MSELSLKFTDIHTKTKRDHLNEEMEKVALEIREKFQKDDRVLKCPCCGSKKIDFYVKKFHFDLDFCLDCGHIFTNPFPTSEALRYYYNSDFKEFENQFFLESLEKRLPIFHQRLDMIKELAAGRRILDVGSAIGIFIQANQDKGSSFDITACDMNASACGYIKSKFPDVNVINADVVELSPGDFDFVTLWDTFEHIPNPKSLLMAVRNQLRENGYFLFSTPNTNSFEWNVMGKDHVQLLPPGHVNLYNTGNISGLLHQYGFEVIEIKTMNPALDLTYIDNTVKNRMNFDILSDRALSILMDLVLNDEVLPALEVLMRKRLFAGNMVVISRRDG